MEVGFAYAIFGGMLGVFSPCNALLLPAFFANIAASKAKLLSLGTVFLAGLLATLVPLGLGLGWLGGTLIIDRGVLLTSAGWVLIILGVLTAFGGGFDISRVFPGKRKGSVAGSLGGSFALGAVSGVAGFCTGPVLGAILTLALTSANTLQGGLLLGLYGLGMIIPIMLIALLIRRSGHGATKWMRGRTFKIGPLKLHSTSVLMGFVTVIVGWLMIFTNGMASIPELLPSAMILWFENLGRTLDAMVPPWVWTLLVGILLLFFWLRAAIRRTTAEVTTKASEATVDESAETN
ncbi:cytochrome C biogenesis protein [Arthrobacter sp. MYb227]|uniref:cytochrome c biogenesis CcdA family protein n=1 Tax=Arthrobacter sp. MYb227 TaxID=1848601 RepID=UPI000CFAE7A4|nr:cytochrome c biogenesis protein CcdA [Arthrobacter sp. MYb227]PQZ86676.1 cytochrome C biogenesis protein [Arthrobacter sp. MYb227]